MHYFKLQQLEFKQLINDTAINLITLKFCKLGKYMKVM